MKTKIEIMINNIVFALWDSLIDFPTSQSRLVRK